MQSTGLVLGIGNDSKKCLKSLENEFPAWQFAILDCWSKVQEVKAVEEQLLEEELQLCFIHNLSFYTRQPKVDVRFDETKYDDAETQKITSYLPHYIDLIRKEKQTCFSDVLKRLDQYTEILFVCPTDDGISVAWLHSLVTELQARATIRIFSWYPFILEGQLKTDIATMLCEQLMDTSAKHYCLFKQEIIEQFKKATIREVLMELETIQQETLRSLLLNERITQKSITNL